MADLPRIRSSRILTDQITLQITPGTTQDSWDDTNGVIGDFSLYPLKIQTAGELVYSGTSLHDALNKTSTENSDYAITVTVMGTQNLALDIRGRRSDADNFVALKIDFSSNTISLVETTDNVEQVLDQASHDFQFLGRTRYIFALWMINDNLFGLVNNFKIVEATASGYVQTEPGLSLSFPSVDAEDPAVIYNIDVSETLLHNDPSLPADPSNLPLEFRLAITEEIENPPARTWETYVRALKFYEQRHVGAPDKTWEALGYPLRKPSAEEWFGNSS